MPVEECRWALERGGLQPVAEQDGDITQVDKIIAWFGSNIRVGVGWVRQLGTNAAGTSYGVSADRLGNVYITGYSCGPLGEPNPGSGMDPFLSKYDAWGNFLWTRKPHTDAYWKMGRGVSADGLGNVYVSGNTNRSFSGASAGDWDFFVSKYDSQGNVVWSSQFGSDKSDFGCGVSTDCLGNVYPSG